MRTGEATRCGTETEIPARLASGGGPGAASGHLTRHQGTACSRSTDIPGRQGGHTPKAGGWELDGRTWDEILAMRAAAEPQQG